MVMAAVLCLGATACGDDEKTALIEKQISKMEADMEARETETEKNNAVEETEISETEAPTEEPTIPEVRCVSARNFSDGYAWVQTETAWCIIDTSGKIVGSVDKNSEIITDFINGYSIILPAGASEDEKNKQIIVDTTGTTVLTIEEYDSIYKYDALEYGHIIVERSEDTFERSGVFYYNINVETGEANQLPLNYEKNMVPEEYFGNGYYSCCHIDAYGEPIFLYQYYNALNNEILDISDSETIAALKALNPHITPDILSISGKRFYTVSNDGLAYFDFNKKETTIIAEGDYEIKEIIDNHAILVNGSAHDYNLYGVTPDDADENGMIEINDATAILTYYAQNAAGLNPAWDKILA